MRRLTVLAIAGAFAAAAFAQHDPNSVWPQFKANDAKSASIEAPGPAAVLDWVIEPDDPNGAGTIPSPGGFTLAGNGDIYYKSNDDGGCRVYRLDPADGSILAQSVIFAANSGSYGGVAVGIDRVYTTIYNGAGDTKIVVLDKTTLATLNEFSGVFVGLRGTPLIGDIPNTNGNVNLYVYDRNGYAIHAVDSVTGEVMWTYDDAYIISVETPFSQLGPKWVIGEEPNQKQAFAFFQNATVFPKPGLALADNGDDSFQVLWSDTGPDCFNWIGSGAMSFDDNIYVTTFWDCGTNVLWKIDRDDGSVIWGVPRDDDPNDPNNPEYNFFGRPAVVGNRVYCGGHEGAIVCFEDLGASYQLKWEMRDFDGEYTSVSAALDGDDVYVYGSRQGGTERFVVLSDDGDSYTEIARHALDLTEATGSIYQNNSVTIDAEGNVYVGLGDQRDPDVQPAAIYKFKVGIPCVGDLDGDGDTDHSDLGILLSDWGCPGPPVVLYDSQSFESPTYVLGDLPGQDGWITATHDPDPNNPPVYEDPEIVDDPTGAGMGQVVWLDAPDGSTDGWVGADRDAPGSVGGITTIEWDQYRPDLGDNFYYADDISWSGWWAVQWDQTLAASAAEWNGWVDLTAGQWQHITYTLDTFAGQATVDVDGDFNSAGFSDTMIDGIEFELAGTAVTGDGPVYIDNLVISEIPGCSGDLDGDGDTDHSDLGILLADWGCVP